MPLLFRAQLFLVLLLISVNAITKLDTDMQQYSYSCRTNVDSTTCLNFCNMDGFCYGYSEINNRCCLKYHYIQGYEQSLQGSSLFIKGLDTASQSSVFWKRGWISQVEGGTASTSGWLALQYSNLVSSLDSESSDIVVMRDSRTGSTLNGFGSSSINSIVTGSNTGSSVYFKTILSYLFYRVGVSGMTLNSIEQIGSNTSDSLYTCMSICYKNSACTTVTYEFSAAQCGLLKYSPGKTFPLGSQYAYAIRQNLVANGIQLDMNYAGTPYVSVLADISECYNICFSDFNCNYSSYDGIKGKCALYTTIGGIVPAQGYSIWAVTTARTRPVTISSNKAFSTASNLQISRASSTTSAVVKFTFSTEVNKPTTLAGTTLNTAIPLQVTMIDKSGESQLSFSKSIGLIVDSNLTTAHQVQETQLGNTVINIGSIFANIGVLGSIGIFLIVILSILACLKCTTFFYDRSKQQRMERVQSRDMMHSKSNLGMARSTSSGFDIPMQPIKSKKQSPLRVDTTPKRRF